MKHDTTIWQSSGAFVFKLTEGETRETPFVNDYSFHVTAKRSSDSTGAAIAYREKFMAEDIVKVLNAALDTSLPRIVPMDPIPPNSNPFHHDLYNMGTPISGGWVAMYNQHAGNDSKGNPFPDPDYIILVNTRTGKRFKLEFGSNDPTELMNAIIKDQQG